MKSKRILLVILLLASGAAHAQFNAFRAMQQKTQAAVQNATGVTAPAPLVEQSPVAATTAPQPVAANNSGDFDAVFGCGQPTGTPTLSALALRGFRLGDICAIPPEQKTEIYQQYSRHAPLGQLLSEAAERALAASTNGNRPSASLEVKSDDATMTFQFVMSRTRPAGLATAILGDVRETICAADATNSLNAGNSFRANLESRFGKPTNELGKSEVLARNATATKLAMQKYGTLAQAAAIGIQRDDALYRGWVNDHRDGTIFELDWDQTDGTQMVAELSQTACGNKPAFDIHLLVLKQDSFLARQWSEPIIAFERNQTQARAVTAPTPKF